MKMLSGTVTTGLMLVSAAILLIGAAVAEQEKQTRQNDHLPSLPEGKTWKIIWHDEFDGKEIDTSKWESPEYERRGHLWRAANAYLDNEGHLVMETSKVEERYASPCLRTKGKFEKKFGFFVARCKLPKEQGHWSAFWMINESVTKVGDEGRDGAEVDIMEWPWRDGRIAHAVHWDGYGKHHKSTSYVSKKPEVLDGKFHTFALWWTPEEYVFYVDGEEIWRPKEGGVCQEPLYLKLSVEIGGRSGDIRKAKLPDYFIVDYVRVYDTVSESE